MTLGRPTFQQMLIQGGTYSPAEFKVLNHEQWTKKHGKKHCKTSIFEGLAPVPSTGHSTKGKPVLNTISFKSLRSPQEEPSKTESKTRSISREANLEPPVPSTGTLESKPEASEIFQAVQELDELDHAKAMSIYKRYTKDGKYPRTAEMLSIIRGTIAQTQEVSQ